MKISFKPLGNRILIKPTPVDSKTSSGIFIPDSAKEKASQGEVIAVRSSFTSFFNIILNRYVKAVVGDHVLYPQHGGTEIKLEGVSYILINEDEVYGIL